MVFQQLFQGDRLSQVGAIAGLLFMVNSGTALAQSISLDGTLGAAGTLTGPSYRILQAVGTTVGSNLFHSFSRFNLNTGERANFQRDAAIRNIFARVTGGDRSSIDGLIRTEGGNVNLFLINPSGILFGPNARLNIGDPTRGSFVATTVDAITFPNGTQFRATHPNEPSSLLRIVGDPSGFLAFRQRSAAIQTFGSLLGVYGQQSLVLLGGDLTVDSVGSRPDSRPSLLGIAGAEGGRVEFGSIAGPGTIQLTTVPTLAGNLLKLTLPRDMARGTISFRHGAIVDALAESGGSISVYARNIRILEGSRLLAGIGGGLGAIGNQSGNITLNATNRVTVSGQSRNGNRSQIFNGVSDSSSIGNAGNILITARSLEVTNGGEINTSTFGQGNAGNVVINVPTVVLDAGFQGGGIFSSMDSTKPGRGGTIVVNSETLSLAHNSRLNTDTTGQGNGGNIRINTRSLFVNSGAKISVGTSGRFNAGNSVINASDRVVVDGFGVDATGRVRRDQEGQPLISQIISGVVTDPRLPESGLGQGGEIRITTGSLVVTNGGELTATTFGPGNAGDLILQVRDAIVLRGRLQQDGLNLPSGLYARTYSQGRAGNITIRSSTGQQPLLIQFQDDAQISVLSTGSGRAGSILMTDPQAITLRGYGTISAETRGNGLGGNIQVITPNLTLQEGINLSASTFGSHRAGNITLNADTLTLSQAATISTNTFASGQAGDLIVNVTDRLQLSGQHTGLFATTAPWSTGKGGNIVIDPRTVLIQDGAAIAVDSNGQGVGGNITLQAGQLQLRNQGSITAETASAQGGNITFNVQDLLLLRQNSLISATAGTAQAGGDGGNITITSPFIIGVLGENSDITANAFTGSGGNINITSNAIYGLQIQSRLTPLSDITASSQFGLSGTVTLNLLNVDPSRGLVAFPLTLVDPSQQIVQTCVPGSKLSSGQFVATGRGGIPLSPDEPLEPRYASPQWIPLPSQDQMIDVGFDSAQPTNPMKRVDFRSAQPTTRVLSEAEARLHLPSTDHQPTSLRSIAPVSPPTTIQSADRWIIGPDGVVELVASLTPDRPASNGIAPVTCQVPGNDH